MTRRFTSLRPFAWGLAAGLLLAAGAGRAEAADTGPPGAQDPETPAVTIRPMVEIGGPFELVTHTGETVTDADFRGKYLLVFFGYTYCPDVCPTTLQTVAQALDELGDEADAVAALFISTDPDRDTPEVLADYVRLFHPRIVGLTGTPEQVARAARAYRVSYAKVKTSGSDGYLMSHSVFIYLMGPDGNLVAIFWPDTDPKEMADAIRAFQEQGP